MSIMACISADAMSMCTELMLTVACWFRTTPSSVTLTGYRCISLQHENGMTFVSGYGALKEVCLATRTNGESAINRVSNGVLAYTLCMCER